MVQPTSYAPSAFQEVLQEREALDAPLAPGGRPIGWRRTRLSKRRSLPTPGTHRVQRQRGGFTLTTSHRARLSLLFFRTEKPGLYSSLLAPGTKHSISDRAAGTTSHPALSPTSSVDFQFRQSAFSFTYASPVGLIISHPHTPRSSDISVSASAVLFDIFPSDALIIPHLTQTILFLRSSSVLKKVSSGRDLTRESEEEEENH